MTPTGTSEDGKPAAVRTERRPQDKPRMREGSALADENAVLRVVGVQRGFRKIALGNSRSAIEIEDSLRHFDDDPTTGTGRRKPGLGVRQAVGSRDEGIARDAVARGKDPGVHFAEKRARSNDILRL